MGFGLDSTSPGFPLNGVTRFLVLEESASTDGKQQFIPSSTPVTLVRQLSANIRMKENGDVLEIEDDCGKIFTLGS